MSSGPLRAQWEPNNAHAIIVEVEREHRKRWNWLSSPVAPIRGRTRSGRWGALSSVLLPGTILLPDDTHDPDVRLDTDFHAADVALLGRLGATDSPREDQELKDDSLVPVVPVRVQDQVHQPRPAKESSPGQSGFRRHDR